MAYFLRGIIPIMPAAAPSTAQPKPSAVRITFKDLWANYPSNPPCINPATHHPAYEDQCSIKLGTALHAAGVSFKSFHGPVCEFGASGSGMVLRAQELADWLMRKPFANCPSPTVIIPGKDFAKHIQGQTGIAFFQHYWLRKGEKLDANRSAPDGTGNHIDLWNRDRLTPGAASFFRFTIGIQHVPLPWGGPGNNWYSDLNNSAKVMFWPIP